MFQGLRLGKSVIDFELREEKASRPAQVYTALIMIKIMIAFIT